MDFVLSYTKDEIKLEILTKLSIGFGIEGYHLRERITCLDKNIYGLKGEGLSWFDNLKEVLEKRGFVK